ncbi:MAG: hypothetical protein EOO47_06195 [Flavobacterium sp.]|nr:MAG: hypothetical protein EOO47_06195 [Flavobacterium sp.]
MKKYIFLFSLLLLAFNGFSQQDTSSFELQRAKVNQLLAERSAKFGHYDESLNSRSGIFGMQTKKDIRNSNEILREIALTDNDIFNELKVLMDYKDLQVAAVKSTADNSAERIENYRKTIKDLQEQNNELSKTSNTSESSQNILTFCLILSLIACAILGCLSYSKHQKLKFYEKTSV